MKYNFDEIIDRRNTNALNTDGFRGYIFHAGPEMKFPYADDEFVRMWVADMEFATPPEICEAIKKRVEKRIFGYSCVYSDDYYQAFSAWCRKMYDWDFPKEELTFSPGIIPALYQLLESLLTKNEKVLMVAPAYGYFQHAAEYNCVEYVCSDLKIDKNGYFTIDFDDFAKKAADPLVKLVLWCNPHNPSGRMWTEEELKRVAEIVEKHNLWLISDEIHCDIIRNGRKHIPMGKVMPDYGKLITCMSASKTFNMAGLMFAEIVIRDKHLRDIYVAYTDSYAMNVNPLSIAAHEAAYRHGYEWLNELKTYLDGNFAFLKGFLTKEFPKIVYNIPEATYLAWVDMNPYLGDVENIPDFMANEAGVLLEGGDALFVDNAKGFIRLNLAMPKSIIKTGLERIRDAVKKHNAK